MCNDQHGGCQCGGSCGCGPMSTQDKLSYLTKKRDMVKEKLSWIEKEIQELEKTPATDTTK